MDVYRLNVRNTRTGRVNVESVYYPYVETQWEATLDPNNNWKMKHTCGKDILLEQAVVLQ
jgi:hypothetical protein